MPIAMAASTVFSFLCRRFLAAIMHGFERRFLFRAHGCFCGGCCPPLPPRLQRAWSRCAVLQSVVSRLVCPPFFGCGVRFSLVGFFWFLGGVLSPLGRPLRRRGGLRSVAARAVVAGGVWRRGVACGVCGTPYTAALVAGSLLHCDTARRTAKREHVWYYQHPSPRMGRDCPLSGLSPPDIASILLTKCIRRTLHQRMHDDSTH